jgi:hypothetical protein
MSKQRRVLESTPHDGLKDATHIDVEVYYTKGGANYWSGGTTQRGYYLSVKPVTHKDGMVSYAMFSGYSKLLLKANRFSDKQLDQAVELGRAEAPALISRVLEEVKSKQTA